MTKKDFELIAASVARTRMASKITGSQAAKTERLRALRLVAIDLAASLRNDNPLFDSERFLKACGMEG